LSYGGDTAKAIAVTETNDCDPTCVAGHHKVATTTIMFSRRIPCKGVPAYAGFKVLATTDPSVAAEGGERDLQQLCREG
jgi:hypothetical protein